MRFVHTEKSLPSISFKLLVSALSMVFLAMLPKALFFNGLDTPEAIGPYLNGQLPSTKPITEENSWRLEKAFSALSFSDPIFMLPEPGTNRIFVGNKRGIIEVFENKEGVSSKRTFLNVSSETYNGGESGLAEFAFHPKYRNGKNYIYICYKWRPSVRPQRADGTEFSAGGLSYFRVSRFTVRSDYNSVDPASEKVLIQQYDRASNHNGGPMFFGKDGYLYILTGDEGGGGDNLYNSQKLDDRLFSGVLTN